MKAKILNRTNLETNRSNLQTCIPLKTPFVIMIDPSSACNLRCKFCPTGDISKIRLSGRYQGYMRFDLFRKIIDDIDEFENPIKTLRLYKEGEPLVNPFFPQFVDYARKSNKVLKIDTTTNGLLLTRDLSRKIIDAGLDQINISINGMTSKEYLFLTKSKADFDSLVENIAYFYSIRGNCEVYIKAIEENLTEETKKLFFSVFGNISDRIFLEHLQPNWPNFTFNYINVDYKVGHYGQELVDRLVCPYIFYMMVINADGTVSACVQDWQHKLLIGNVKEESIKNIWNGSKLKYLQISHLKKQKSELPICSVCPVLKHGALDNIDAAADNLLRKLIEE
jgi:radical SAM protein with 4Fe4S-binding SPASM domain